MALWITMTLPPPNTCRRMAQLHAMIGSSAENEARIAREKLVALLKDHGCSWNDLGEILRFHPRHPG